MEFGLKLPGWVDDPDWTPPTDRRFDRASLRQWLIDGGMPLYRATDTAKRAERVVALAGLDDMLAGKVGIRHPALADIPHSAREQLVKAATWTRRWWASL